MNLFPLLRQFIIHMTFTRVGINLGTEPAILAEMHRRKCTLHSIIR